MACDCKVSYSDVAGKTINILIEACCTSSNQYWNGSAWTGTASVQSTTERNILNQVSGVGGMSKYEFDPDSLASLPSGCTKVTYTFLDTNNAALASVDCDSPEDVLSDLAVASAGEGGSVDTTLATALQRIYDQTFRGDLLTDNHISCGSATSVQARLCALATPGDVWAEDVTQSFPDDTIGQSFQEKITNNGLADAVWDEPTGAHTAFGTFGACVCVAADPWSVDKGVAFPANSMGECFVDNLCDGGGLSINCASFMNSASCDYTNIQDNSLFSELIKAFYDVASTSATSVKDSAWRNKIADHVLRRKGCTAEQSSDGDAVNATSLLGVVSLSTHKYNPVPDGNGNYAVYAYSMCDDAVTIGGPMVVGQMGTTGTTTYICGCGHFSPPLPPNCGC